MSIHYTLSEKAKFLYQPEHIELYQQLEPSGRRIDELKPTNASQNQDQFILQQPRANMNLKIKKTDYYTVTITDQTNLPVAGDVAASTPAIIDNWNWFVDNLAESKAINGIRIAWGNSSLESTRDDRNPWLMEVKSSQFDLEECERYGLSPLAFSGVGPLSEVLPYGVLNYAAVDVVGANSVLPPLNIPQNAVTAPFVKKQQTLTSNVRVEILSASFTTTEKDAGGNVIQLTANNNDDSYPGVWVPFNQATNALYYSVRPAVAPAPAVNEYVTGTYTIRVTEYLVDDFLVTPYQKSRTEKCIAVSPASFVTFNFQYDTNYISNGLFQYVGKSSQANANKCIVTRIANESKIEVETFDFTIPPPANYSLKIISWRPTRLDAQSVDLINGGASDGSNDIEITINDQSSTVLGQYHLISAVPEFWTGNLASKLPNSTNANQDSTFFPADITDCKIQIGQTTITDSILFSDLKKMSADLVKNPELADWVSCKGDFVDFSYPGVLPRKYKNRGCPFLLLDISKLSMLNATDCIQQLPNVDYPTVQSVKITYKVRAQKLDLALNGNVTYTPHVYKFYPYVYEQREGQAMTKKQLTLSLQYSIEMFNSYPRVKVDDLDYNMIGNGWFEDVSDFFKAHGKTVGKALIGAVRLGEELTRGSLNPYAVAANRGMQFVSDVAKSYGYGPAKKDQLMAQMAHAQSVKKSKRANF